MLVLRQSTARTVMVGPFLDASDGVTPESGLASNGTEISKNGGAFATGPVLGTHDSDGWYPISLTTAHTDTLGRFVLKSQDHTTHAAVWIEAFVIPAALYDILWSGGTISELSQATPAATPTLPEALMLLYMALRNETNTSASSYQIKNDAGTVIAKQAISESSGTVTRGEMTAGP